MLFETLQLDKNASTSTVYNGYFLSNNSAKLTFEAMMPAIYSNDKWICWCWALTLNSVPKSCDLIDMNLMHEWFQVNNLLTFVKPLTWKFHDQHTNQCFLKPLSFLKQWWFDYFVLTWKFRDQHTNRCFLKPLSFLKQWWFDYFLQVSKNDFVHCDSHHIMYWKPVSSLIWENIIFRWL